MVQPEEDGLDRFFWSELRGIDDNLRDTRIKRTTMIESKLCLRRIRKNRAIDLLQHAAIEKRRKRGIEKDAEGIGSLFDQKPVGQAFGSPPSQGKDNMGFAER